MGARIETDGMSEKKRGTPARVARVAGNIVFYSVLALM